MVTDRQTDDNRGTSPPVEASLRDGLITVFRTIMLIFPSLISLTTSSFTPQGVYCEKYPLLEGNMVEFNFNIPYLRMIYCTVQHCTALYCAALYCTVLHIHTFTYCIVQHCTALHYLLLCCNALYCNIFHCTTMYYNVQHFAVLNQILLLCSACTSMLCAVIFRGYAYYIIQFGLYLDSPEKSLHFLETNALQERQLFLLQGRKECMQCRKFLLSRELDFLISSM